MKVVVVLPTYNEAENISLLIPELLALGLDVCVVDDNSPDGTGKLADEIASREPQVHVVHRAGKLGLGTAYYAGFQWAMQHGFEGVLTMDADFSHHPRYLPAMLAAFDKADVVIGSRYVPGGELHYGFVRRAFSKSANAAARFLLGLKPRDCTAGFRLYHTYVLKGIPLDTVFSNGYSYLLETLTLITKAGFSVAEVPIIFEDRVRGESKISSKEVQKAMYTLVRLSARRFLRPLKETTNKK